MEKKRRLKRDFLWRAGKRRRVPFSPGAGQRKVNKYSVETRRPPHSLPNQVVHAESTNTFKSRLDKFWSNQEIIYGYRVAIQV